VSVIRIKIRWNGKVHPITGREDADGQLSYSSTPSLTSALDSVTLPQLRSIFLQQCAICTAVGIAIQVGVPSFDCQSVLDSTRSDDIRLVPAAWGPDSRSSFPIRGQVSPLPRSGRLYCHTRPNRWKTSYFQSVRTVGA
jgi:hypothetical protein